MMDIKYIKENPEAVKENMKKKFREDLHLVDDAIKAHDEKLGILKQVQELKTERNKASEEINNLKKAGQDASEAIARMKEMPGKIKTAGYTSTLQA